MEDRDYNDDTPGYWICWLIICAMFLAIGMVIGKFML